MSVGELLDMLLNWLREAWTWFVDLPTLVPSLIIGFVGYRLARILSFRRSVSLLLAALFFMAPTFMADTVRRFMSDTVEPLSSKLFGRH